MHNRHRSPGNGYRSSVSSSFGVAPPPPPPPPPPPQPRRANSFQPLRKADIFAEAGRLAAEYLVSQGLLPPTVLSSNFKRSVIRPPDSPDNFAAEGRTSALARLGNPAIRRRFNVDEFRSKSSSTRRRPYRAYGGSDWGRDYPRTPSFHDRFSRDSPDLDGDADADADAGADFHSEPPRPTPNPPTENLPSKNEEEPAPAPAPAPAPDSDDNSNFKRTVVEDDNLTIEDKATSSLSEVVVVETDKDKDKEKDDDSTNNTTPDLRTICKFAKVPTRIRSSKTSKKVDPVPASEVSKDSSGMLKAEAVKSATDDDIRGVGDVYDLERNNSSTSSSQERGEKRGLEEGEGDADDNGQEERAKRAREWPPSSSVVMEAGDCFNISNLNEKQATSHENSMVNNPQFSTDGVEQEHGVEFSQGKQLFRSFKICDLNLMEVSDAHESRDGNPIMIYPPMRRESSPIDVDLSSSKSTNPAGENNRRPLDVKEIEVIDLENDSAQEEKDMDMDMDMAIAIEDRKTETVYTDLEGFPSHAQNTSDIPDVQDGYGLMISELLGNDFPNCSSVPGNINPLHNDIGLHNGEGALADDDSIYMSLGEIPLTFLRPWEQPPPQEYEPRPDNIRSFSDV